MLKWNILFTFIVLTLCSIVQASGPDYSENLFLRPLLGSSILASFNFQSNTSQEAFENQHFRHFPRSLGQILQYANTRELHLRFATGRWDADIWGPRPRDGVAEGGTGVELWAWVEAEDDLQAQQRWFTLVNALSGLFCASMNFIDATRTTRPVMTFSPEGYHTSSNLHLLHGTLPREVVCTENLTPFLKLLPCKGKAGISSLFDGHKLFDSAWQSMSVDVRPVQQDGSQLTSLEISQSIDMVLNIERAKRLQDDPIPRPLPITNVSCDPTKWYNVYGDSCYPIDNPDYHFTLTDLFGRSIKGNCPLGDLGHRRALTVCLEVSKQAQVQVLTGAAYQESNDEQTKCFTMPDNHDFDLDVAESSSELISAMARKPFLTVERTLTGRGQQYGGLRTVFTNPSPEPVTFVYLEILPWFLRPYLHTLDAKIEPLASQRNSEHERPSILKTFYKPALDRARATHLELVLSIPRSSRLVMTYDVEKAILRYAEYPPDANRGFDVAPAIVRVLAGNEVLQQSSYIRTTSLLLYLPTPDFSMPYNVIILSSTVIALAFGTVFNLIVRRFVAADEVGSVPLKQRIKQRFSSLIDKFIKKDKAE